MFSKGIACRLPNVGISDGLAHLTPATPNRSGRRNNNGLALLSPGMATRAGPPTTYEYPKAVHVKDSMIVCIRPAKINGLAHTRPA
jgi:hypothetical protein